MSDERKPNKRLVKDEFGQQFELKSKLGEGGQGLVCTTQFEQVLVKINTQADKKRKSQWMEHIRWLMRQPLEQLNIAKPFARIPPQENKGNVGYALELMHGLIPLQSLMDETESAMDESEGSPEKYLETGGIKRRMRLLARLARTLADLHSRGLAFGDLSPSNIFVSKEVEYDQVWLIDCDNICVNQRDSYDSSEVEGRPGRVYSPGYGAPEVVNGDAFVSSLTDSWSFAVIALKLLTTNHPFIGEFVDSGTPEDEERAFNGELAWIYHSEDFSNEVFKGLPLELVALKPLRDAFERCFELGKDNPTARPTLNEWAEVFERMSHLLVRCQSSRCNATYNFDVTDGVLLCPFCDTKASSSQVLFIRNVIEDTSLLNIEGASRKDSLIDTGYSQTLNLNEELVVKNSPPGSVYWHESGEAFSLSLTTEHLIVKPAKGKDVKFSIGSSSLKSFSKEIKLASNERDGKWLRFAPQSSGSEGLINSFWVKW
ncbi:protein kinase [Vibrio sp. 1F255]|uniref:protein kinase domain-containing protein n=1 Tax=Vibrio sp. 1F255 TaxID=3230009 RepID=UPI00352C5B93